MASAFEYLFKIGGNYKEKITGMTDATGKFTGEVEKSHDRVQRWASLLATFEYAKNLTVSTAEGINALSGAGIKLDSQMHDLSAVAGVTGDGLKQIETFARQSAKTFGTDASVAVEGYKLLLSQLSPELGKYPEALSAMGDCIQTTSKMMGGDGVAAAQVLTTAMNQYGVSLEDPTAASEEMARMMNVMAAAGQAGSAELPAISAALTQCGMAAKAANVSFEETNAAIQVLDKAGKKASEGGVALRNVLGQLSKGRFIEKAAREELEAAGIDVIALGDNSKSLQERLEMLKPLLNDSALLSKFFGVENANAARALIQGTDQLQGFTEAVTGTNSATDQAAIIMDSYAERQARVNQQIEDFKITLFQATGDATLWAGAIMDCMVPLAQLTPLLSLIGALMKSIKNLQWGSMWQWIQRVVYASRFQIAAMNKELITGKFASEGFLINITRATLAVLRFTTVGIYNALKGLGALILSLVTGGTMSTTFSAIASTAFSTFATVAKTACNAVRTAIFNIPIIGWIAFAISLLITLGSYFWNTFAKFRAVLKGTWEAFKACFTGIGKLASDVFGAIGELIVSAFSLDGKGIDKAIDKLKGGFSDYGKTVGEAFNKAYDEEMAEAAKKDRAANKEKEKIITRLQQGKQTTLDNPPQPSATTNPTGTTLSTVNQSGTGADGGGKIKNITIHIEKLVERFEIHSATVGESVEQVKTAMLEALMGALNDTQLATS